MEEQLGSTVLSDEYEGDEWDDFEPEEEYLQGSRY